MTEANDTRGKDDARRLTPPEERTMPAPDLDYRPRLPKGAPPGIGLVGAGGITETHLAAYSAAGLPVRIICDVDLARARARRDAFYPEAEVTDQLSAVLARDDVEVLDIATHPAPRLGLIEAALGAGRHVLSQKPFVLDLDQGEQLADLAEVKGVRLAVNQNGRWAPHLSWMREAVRAGLVGDLVSVHMAVHWDHNWTAGTAFDEVDDLIFYDFAIHWFDFLASLAGGRARTVHATRTRSRDQAARPPLFAQALVELEDGQASLVFDGGLRHGALDSTYVGGSAGSLISRGPSLNDQSVTLATAEGRASPALGGTWFREGFLGTMGELLCAIEERREPSNGARGNLDSLGLCFAAIASSRTGQPVGAGSVRRLESV